MKRALIWHVEHEHRLHSHGYNQGRLQTQISGQKDKPQDEKRKKSGGTQLATRKIRRKGAGLIKHLGGADKKKGEQHLRLVKLLRQTRLTRMNSDRRNDMESHYITLGRQRVYSS